MLKGEDEYRLLADDETSIQARSPGYHVRVDVTGGKSCLKNVSLATTGLLVGALVGLALGRWAFPFCSGACLEDLDDLNKMTSVHKEYFNLTLGQYSPYTVGAGPETDRLWDNITAPPGNVGMIVISEEENNRLGLESVRLADGSGHLATVDVFHQLHCLDMLRRNIVQPDMEKEELWTEHIAHCIDSLRLSIQCHADTSLIPFKWIEGYSLPWPDFKTHHTCRNFDEITEWVAEREYSEEKGDWIHPKLGSKNVTVNPFLLPGGVVYIDMDEN